MISRPLSPEVSNASQETDIPQGNGYPPNPIALTRNARKQTHLFKGVISSGLCSAVYCEPAARSSTETTRRHPARFCHRMSPVWLMERILHPIQCPKSWLSCRPWGLCRDNRKENGNYYNGLYKDYLGIMEKKMETTVV